MNDCEFHNGSKPIFYKNDKNCIFIDSAGLMDIYIDDKHFRLTCEFCPKCGERLRVIFLNNFNDILKTEYSTKFDDIRKNMMIVSYYKYGPLKDNYGTYKCMNAIENLKIRLQKYIDTGNTEYLADVANFAMLEFMNPSIEGARYEPTDNPDCEISGFSINEIRNFNNERK